MMDSSFHEVFISNSEISITCKLDCMNAVNTPKLEVCRRFTLSVKYPSNSRFNPNSFLEIHVPGPGNTFFALRGRMKKKLSNNSNNNYTNNNNNNNNNESVFEQSLLECGDATISVDENKQVKI